MLQGDGGKTDAVSAGDAGGCDPMTPFTPVTWAPPTPFASACTAAQLAACDNCVTVTGDCSAFRASASNAGCLACLETDVGAAAHGPLVTEGQGANLAPIQANFGGCIATIDGDTSATSCGARFNDFVDCSANDCQSCADWQNPSPSGPTAQCNLASRQTGSCVNDTVTQSCDAQINSDAGAAKACGPAVSDLIRTWCGGGGADAGGD